VFGAYKTGLDTKQKENNGRMIKGAPESTPHLLAGAEIVSRQAENIFPPHPPKGNERRCWSI
jgi:hypothetical protein